MTQPINQKLGFDASDAIRSLGRLSVSLDVVNNQLGQLNRATNGNPFANLSGQQAAKLQQALSGIGNQTKLLGRNLGNLDRENNVGKLANNFGFLERVVSANIISRGITQITQAVQEGAEAFREFELTIARTETIANQGDNFENLSTQVRSFALATGRDLQEVASAAFQTLQNDVGTTAESFQFLRVASDLANVQGAELETTMNALTSIMKSYGQEVGQAASNSDILFAAVDTGRLTLDELADRLGTINPLAAELGLSFDQVAAASAALTQTGLNTATATTQLRNVLTKLIDPTKQLEESFRRLGVNSGRELLELAGGSLPTALNLLTTTFNGSEAAAANAFGTIRGQLGVLNLLANDTSVLNDILEQFADRQGSAAEAFGRIEQTKAIQYQKEVAKIRDVFLDLGSTFQDIQLGALRIFNAGITDADSLKAAVIGLGTSAATAFLLFRTGADSATVSVARLSAATKTLGAALAIGALVSIATAQITELSKTGQDRIKELQASFFETQQRQLEESQRVQNEITANIERENNKRKAGFAAYYADIAKLYIEDNDRYDRSTQRIGITANRVAEQFVSSREDLLQNIDSFIENIDNRIERGTSRIRSAAQDLADFDFEQRTKGLNDLQRSFAETSRAAETAAQAARAFNTAGVDEKRIEQARELQRLAEEQARQALGSAQGTNNESRAAALVRETLQQRIRLEEQANQRLAQFDKIRAAEQRDQLETLFTQEKSAVEELAALNQRLNAEGKTRTREQFEEDTRRAVELGQQIESIREQIRSVPILDQTGLRQASESASQAFQQGISSARFDFRNAVDGLQAALAAKTFDVRVRAVNDLFEGSATSFTSGAGGATPADFANRVAELSEVAKQGQLVAQQVADLDNSINNQINTFKGTLDANVQALGTFERTITGLQNARRASNDTLITKVLNQAIVGSSLIDFALGTGPGTENNQPETLKLAKESANLLLQAQNNQSAEGLQAANQGLDQLQAKVEQLSAANLINPDQVATLNSTITAARDTIGLFATRLEAIPTVEEKTKFAEAEAALSFLTNSVGNLNNALQTSNDLMNGLGTAASNVSIPGLGGGSGAGPNNRRRYFGGIVHRAFGGQLTRGMDSQLVAASPGEMIVNSRSASRFFSQLQAMNAGQNPVFRNEGGPVTNVGDINVNISNPTGPIDGRQIADSLRRELRRRG